MIFLHCGIAPAGATGVSGNALLFQYPDSDTKASKMTDHYGESPDLRAIEREAARLRAEAVAEGFLRLRRRIAGLLRPRRLPAGPAA